MKTVRNFIKKIFKAILWMVGIFVLLFLIVAGIIQIPFVQNKIVNFATTFVSNKTQTRVEIQHVSITFPKSLVIKGIYLEDTKQDTLLYAGKTYLNIGIKQLMQQKLQLHDFLLQDVYLNVYNSAQDSLFNYQFLIDAFSDTTTIVEKEDSITWTVDANLFRLKNVRLRYADVWNKLSVTTQLQLVELKGTNIALENLALTCENIHLKAFNLNYLSGDNHPVSNQFNTNKIDLSNIEFKARDLSFAPDKTSIEILQLAAEEQQGIAIRQFNMLFEMDEKSAYIHDLTLHTNQSTIEAEISLHYPSLAVLADSISELWIEADIQKASFSKDEIKMLAGFAIPENIDIPNQINLKASFKGRLNAFDAAMVLDSDFGGATMLAVLHEKEQFDVNFTMLKFDTGKLLKDTEMFGPVSLVAQFQGKGFDMKTAKLQIMADVSQAYFNQYNYQKLSLNGDYSQQQFTGNINMRDENLQFNFDGLANLVQGKEFFNFNLDLLNANFQALKLTDDDLYTSFTAKANIKGMKPDRLNGTVNLSDLHIVQNNKSYELDSIVIQTQNTPGKSMVSIRSSLVDFFYEGNISPVFLPEILNPYFSKYLSENKSVSKKKQDAIFGFELKIHDHPLLTELFVPDLEVFVPELIKGNFNNNTEKFSMQAGIIRAVYSGIEIENMQFKIDADSTILTYKLAVKSIENEQIHLDNLLLNGDLKGQTLTALLSSIDNEGNKNFVVDSRILFESDQIKLHLNPENFYLMNKQWKIDPENYIVFGKEGFLIHQLNMQQEKGLLSINSVNEKFNDDISILLEQFSMDEISRLIDKENLLVGGMLSGNILLKKTEKSYGIVADANISDLVLMDVPIGNLTLSAQNPFANRFDIEATISGKDNNLHLSGFLIPDDKNQSINLNADIASLSMKTIEAFSAGELASSSGYLTGQFKVTGNFSKPELSGDIAFKNVETTPAFLNNRIAFTDETIRIDNAGIYFDSFTIRDVNNQTASIMGTVKMKDFSNFVFDLRINANHFQLFNTSAKDNDLFYGRMLIDSKIQITGPIELPVVQANIKLKEGSRVSFIVPRTELNTYKGEDVVVFITNEEEVDKTNQSKVNSTNMPQLIGIDLTSVIEVDKDATLRLFMEPASTDSLVVKGQAALGLTMDRSGKMSLTGSYNLEEGSYLVSLESIIRKKFNIVQGSTIVWNGDPMDANVNINAAYQVRTAPFNLVADQLGGLPDTQRKAYLQQYPFTVLLKMRGELLKPEISFEIKMPQENQGIFGGSVQQKLNQLNENPSALNKQVFALLILDRFVQENPLQTESAGATALVRSTVSNFLSDQLNKLSASFIPGFEMNFDLQSYEDYESGDGSGRTELSVGVKKELFDERLSVQVGGTVELEGEKATQNKASDIASDVIIEYKLTEDGRYRLKGFRKNQYDGVIDGQLVETGAGVVYVREFNTLKELFKRE